MVRRLIIGADRYNFEAKDGSRVVGANVYYLEPRPEDANGNRKGFQVVKIPASNEAFLGVRELPGFYEVEEGIKVNAKGHGEVTCQSVRLAAPLDMVYSEV